MNKKQEISIEEIQKALCNHKGYFYVLSKWIEVLKAEFPTAEIRNSYGSTSGRINGVLYDFYEGRYPMNNAPLVSKSRIQ